MLGALVLLACLALGWQTYRRPEIGLGAIGIAFALQCLYGNDQPGILVAGINTYAGDLAAIILFQAALLRLAARSWRSWGLPTFGGLALGIILFQSFARGLLAFGLKQAGLGFRGAFITYAFLFFGLAYLDLPALHSQVKRGMAAIFIFLVAVVLVRWALVATGIYVNPDWGTSTGAETRVPMRVINAGEAFLLGQISLLWLAWRRHQRAAWLGLLMVLLLQHRSVWLATLAGGGYLAFWRYRKGGGFGLTPRSLKLLALGLLSVGLASTRLPAIRTALESSTTNEGTWVWRLASWATALAPDQMPGWAWIIGKPFGTPTTRFMLGQVVDVGFHNHYVVTLVQTGLLGLIAWLLLWGLAWRNRHAHHWVALLVLAQVVFGVPYYIDGIQGFMLALALSPGSFFPSIFTPQE